MICATDMAKLCLKVTVYKSSAVAEMGDHGHYRHRPKRKGGCYAPFTRGAGSPANTMWPGPRSTSIPSGVFIHPAIWPQQTWAKNWGLGPDLTQSCLGRCLPPSRRLATMDMGQKFWGLCPFREGELGHHLTQCRLG